MTTEIAWSSTPAADLGFLASSGMITYIQKPIWYVLEDRSRNMYVSMPQQQQRVQLTFADTLLNTADMLFTLLCLGEAGVNWFTGVRITNRSELYKIRQLGSLNCGRNVDFVGNIAGNFEVITG